MDSVHVGWEPNAPRPRRRIYHEGKCGDATIVIIVLHNFLGAVFHELALDGPQGGIDINLGRVIQ